MSRLNWRPLLGASLFSIAMAVGQDGTRPANPTTGEVDAQFFIDRIRPIFQEHCAQCHGENKQRGGLRLDSPDVVFKSRKPYVVAGDLEKSLMWRAVSYSNDVKMPPKKKLSDEKIADLRKWIEGGAAWPTKAP